MTTVDHTRLESSNFFTPPDLPPEDRRITVAEAARAAGLTIPQIWSRITTGKLRAHVIPPPPPPPPRNKRGRRPSTFIDRAELEALIGLAVKVRP
jgi:hypothetical protein